MTNECAPRRDVAPGPARHVGPGRQACATPIPPAIGEVVRVSVSGGGQVN
jgi:hypothetical protein